MPTFPYSIELSNNFTIEFFTCVHFLVESILILIILEGSHQGGRREEEGSRKNLCIGGRWREN